MNYQKEYNETWKKVKKIIKKEFDSEPVYNDKYIKANIVEKWNKN